MVYRYKCITLEAIIAWIEVGGLASQTYCMCSEVELCSRRRFTGIMLGGGGEGLVLVPQSSMVTDLNQHRSHYTGVWVVHLGYCILFADTISLNLEK